MGEEAGGYEYEFDMFGGGGGGEKERVMEWETGLPGSDELTPLSQPLVPRGLAAAFRIPPEPGRTVLDVHRASAATVSRLRRATPSPSPPTPAAAADEGAAGEESSGGGAAKRARLVWTPQLHKRFVEVVAHLGIKKAVPKTIMQLMNVEGLTRENVASHLQKYRLYVKRMQQGGGGGGGFDDVAPSPSDHIFASTPVPPHVLVHDPHPHPPQHQQHPQVMYHHHPVHPVAHPAAMMKMSSGGAGHHTAYNAYGYAHGQGVPSYPHYHHAEK